MIKKLSLVLIVVGVLVAISPVVGMIYTRWYQNRIIEQWYNSVDVSDASEPAQADPEESYGQLAHIFAFGREQENGAAMQPGNDTESNRDYTPGSDSEQSQEANASENNPRTESEPKPRSKPQYTVLGIIEIEKIKLKYPILEGVRASDLKVGIGHIPGTAGLGENGNCVLAGHRNYTFGRFFNRLDELTEGDIINVTTKKAQYKYKVYKKHVVTPDDVSILKGKKDESILTLVTCTPIYIATHRLIVHASLEEIILLEP